MGFSRQEHWSGLPCPPRGTFPTQGSHPGLLHCRWPLVTGRVVGHQPHCLVFWCHWSLSLPLGEGWAVVQPPGLPQREGRVRCTDSSGPDLGTFPASLMDSVNHSTAEVRGLVCLLGRSQQLSRKCGQFTVPVVKLLPGRDRKQDSTLIHLSLFSDGCPKTQNYNSFHRLLMWLHDRLHSHLRLYLTW